MNSIILLYISIFIASIGQLILKVGLNKLEELILVKSNIWYLFLRIFTNPILLLGLLFYGVSAFLWLIGLSKVPLSKAYPLVSLSYIIVVFLSWLLLRENISLLKIVALAIICFGVFLLSRTT